MIHRRSEGEKPRQGLNWTWDKFSHPAIMLKVGRLVMYGRRRSSFVMSGNKDKQRYIFSGGMVNKPNLSILPWKRFD